MKQHTSTRRANREAASGRASRCLFRTPNAERRTPPPAFTLIELMVVISIMLVLAAITVSAINLTIDGDKVRAGARQVQSYLEGARSRASYAKAPRGVRFLLDPTDPRTVSSMVYIAPTEPWDEGTVVLERLDADDNGTLTSNSGTLTWQQTGEVFPGGSPSHVLPYVDPANPSDNKDDVWVLRGFDGAETAPPFSPQSPAKSTNWKDLLDRGVLRDGNLIEIPPGSKNWYAIDTRLLKVADVSDGKPPVRLLLQARYRSQADTPDTSLIAFNRPIRYQLQLNPAPLPNQEPVLLPKGVVVHLDRCSSDPDGKFLTGPQFHTPFRRGDRLPSSWRVAPSTTVPPNPAGFDYSPYCDIMFAPRGAVNGQEASAGLIHLYVGEQKDADRDDADWDPSITPPGAGLNWSAPESVPGKTASDPTGEDYQRGDKLIVSIFTRTGAISSNPLFVGSNGGEVNGERFRYSETGEVAGK